MSSNYKSTNMPVAISSIKAETYNCEISNSDFFEKILHSFANQKFCDVTLSDANGEIQVSAHRLILTARSDYFSSMFSGSFKEAGSTEVKLEEIDGKALQMVINYMYSNKIELESDTVENVLKAAHLLQIRSLEEACCEFLTKQLDTCNVLGVLFFAEQYNITYLCEYAFEFAVQHFMELRHNEEFFSLDVHQLSKLISSDNLRVYSEEEVFDSILSWVKHDKGQRVICIEELFPHLRLTSLRPQFIANAVEPAIKSSKCKELIYKSYKWHCLPELRQSLQPEHQIKQRILNDAFIAIDGWDIVECNLRVALYSPALKEWFYREIPGLSDTRSQFGSITMNDKFYIAGGFLGSKGPTNRVDCLDLKTFQWTQLPPLLTTRWGCSMGALKGQLYVVGGKNEERSMLDTVEKYDPLVGEWEYITRMRNAVFRPIVGVHGSSLCISRNAYNGERILDIYDPLSEEWTYEWSHVKHPLFGMATVSINGGDNFFSISKTEAERYIFKSNETIILSISCMEDYSYTSFAVWNGSFITYNKYGFKKYCPVHNLWETLPDVKESISQLLVICQRI